MSEEMQGQFLITAIKMKRKDSVEISYTKGNAEISGEFKEPPDPHFISAMAGLRNAVAEIIELPMLAERIFPFAVKLSYNAAMELGATISAKLEIPLAEQSVTINTPFRWLDTSEDANDKHLNPAQGEMLYALIKEAQEYLAGHRAQTSLFNQDGTISDDQTPADTPAA